MIYNNLSDDKCESLLGMKNDKQPQEMSIKDSCADDLTLKDDTKTGKDNELFHIDGLEDFSFINPP